MLPGAAITVKHVATGLTRAAQTDTSGNFTIPSLPVGPMKAPRKRWDSGAKCGRGSTCWWKKE